jgi:L-fucose isomerase-like protein
MAWELSKPSDRGSEWTMAHSRIGFVTCVHPTFSLPSVFEFQDAAISGLRRAGCDVFASTPAKDPDNRSRIIQELKSGEIDLLLFFFCTWADEAMMLAIAQELKSIPLFLWALPYLDPAVPMPSPITGLTTTGCNLRRAERPFLYQIGNVTSDRLRAIARTARIASIVKKLQTAKFGIFGQNCPGAIDTECDDALLKQCLGITIMHGAVDDLIRAMDTASKDEALDLAKKITERIGRSEIALDQLANQCRLLLVMKAMVQTHRLDGFAVRCWPELRDQHQNTICLAMAEMAESGVVSACQADVTALITSFILTSLTGRPSCTLEITAYLEEQNALQLAHCGSAAASLASDSHRAVIRPHMRTGAGAVIEFPFQPRAVTIAKLLRPSESRLKMFVTRGEIMPAGDPMRGNVATVRVEPSPQKVIESILHYKVEHNLVLVYGDWMEDLMQLAQFTGIEILSAEDYQFAQFAGLEFLRP